MALTKRKTIIIIAVSLVVLIISLILILYLLGDCNGVDDRVMIDSDGVVSEEYEVNSLELYPGADHKFEVSISTKVSGNFNVTLNFSEISDGGLKPFIIVDIIYNDELVKSERLSTLLNGDAITFEGEVKTSRSSNLKIIYKMPIETDDTAQDTTASFNVGLKIDRK